MSAIFVNSAEKRCGIHQYGLRIYTNIKDILQIDYAEVSNVAEYIVAVAGHKKVLINYYCSLFYYLDVSNQDADKEYYYLYHEAHFYNVRPGPHLNNDPTRADGIPRPIAFANEVSYSLTNTEHPVIGSFGFGFLNKNFHELIDLVQSQFDKATIRLLMPGAYWGDEDAQEARQSAELCRRKITKPGIQLWICHNFLSNEDLLTFLGGNDLNVFLYQPFPNRGCSSVIDYALGVNRPLAISESDMFRHIYDDRICVSKTPLRTIIQNGPEINARFRQMWSKDALALSIQKRLDLPYKG